MAATAAWWWCRSLLNVLLDIEHVGVLGRRLLLVDARRRFLAGLGVPCHRVQLGTFRSVYFLELAEAVKHEFFSID